MKDTLSLNSNTKSRQGEVKVKYDFNKDEKVQRYESKREKRERQKGGERDSKKPRYRDTFVSKNKY